MSTNIYLGNPADYIKVWTIRNFADPTKTWVEYVDGTKTQLSISGQLGSSSIPDKANARLVVIGNTVTSIGDQAFNNCKSLANVYIPDSVTSIAGGAFFYCSSLTSVNIPSSVTSIGTGTFSYCMHLASITIPNSITSIGNQAFFTCESLTSIIIPSSVTSFGEWIFQNCTSLKSVTFEGKTMAEVQAMNGYSWSLNYGSVIHCTDGDITI